MSGNVVNRVSELERPSEEFPRNFMPNEINLSEWDQIEPLFRELLDRQLDSVESIEHWLYDRSELCSVIEEEGSRRYIAMTCATNDQETEKAFLQFVEEIEPRTKPFWHEIDKKLVNSAHVDDLDPGRYDILLRSSRNQIELFREENITIETEITKLSQQYQKIMGAMTVNFKGEELTMQQMGKFLEENSRDLRKDAFDAITHRRLQDSEKLEDTFDQMLALRNQIAENAGFEDFRAYKFRRMERFDYTPQDCLNFHDAIEKIVVPLQRQILDDRRKALNIATVRPWDMTCDRYGRTPLKPFEDTDNLVHGCHEIFDRIDPELGTNFQRMIDLGLLDLESRKGKAPGGYQTTLHEMRLPFIFMNAVGLNRDIFTMLHEGGHAFHTFAAREEPIFAYRHAPMEFCEVASMAMEHLGEPYLESFYSPGDAARARRDHLEGAISILPWIAIIDAFQHWIYTHQDHNRNERAACWIDLMERFGAGVDYTGYEDVLRYRWHAQLHIFEVPFYYIEYGIALLGALQVWRNSFDDQAGAVKAYKEALKFGGSRPLPDLFTAADARFDFSAMTIEPLMDKVREEIEKQAKLETH